jgi:methyltransferase (TIGR00027 family)
MREDRPSFTARRVASQRAKLARPSSPNGDPDAEQRLYEGLVTPLLFSRVDPNRMLRRTRWFDDVTVDALGRGVTQVVIVGAGYDGRALRFADGSVRWIEVDHPATQADKRRRVATLGVSLAHITFAPVDLVHDDLGAALAKAGHDERKPTLLICEGLLGYLPLETVVTLLTDLRIRSAPDTVLAVNFRVSEQPRWLGDRIGRGLIDGILNLVGEARITDFHEGEPELLLADTGWRVVRQDTSDHTRIDGGSRGQLVVATPGALPAHATIC